MVQEHSKVSDQSSSIFYVRMGNYVPFVCKRIEAQLKRLEELEYCKVTEYIRPSTGQADQSIRQVNILPAGMEPIRAKITEQTVATTEKIMEFLPEDGEYSTPQKRRQFPRTERGYAIMNATPDALASYIRCHIDNEFPRLLDESVRMALRTDGENQNRRTSAYWHNPGNR
jgi:hypothetical protein